MLLTPVPGDRAHRSGDALRMLGHEVTESTLTSPLPSPELTAADAVIVASDGAVGTDACREIRRATGAPLLVLASRHDEVDTISDLAVGADDVVAPPVSAREIDARLRAILRRSRNSGTNCSLSCSTHEAQASEIVVEPSGLRIDPHRQTVTRDGQPIRLTATEFRLLIALAERRGVPQSRESLLSTAWGHGFHGKSRIVDNAVQRLRGKIDTPSWRHVHSVRGFGYVLR
ncbi:winged helix-turn-helix domain-containing protein [Tsukamurella ocularis]|uniref:winged helix-turn-helix domain-containing protein n=1 Tax=Tsukamurella ocularis TaxID=1970234 RepID=UPI0039EE3A23